MGKYKVKSPGGDYEGGVGNVVCGGCQRSLTRNWFPKAELCQNRGGQARAQHVPLCRDCSIGMLCCKCQVRQAPVRFPKGRRPGSSAKVEDTCIKCLELELVEKDAVATFDVERAHVMQQEMRSLLLLIFTRHGVTERALYERIYAYLKVPYVLTVGWGCYYCELCNELFLDSDASRGQTAVSSCALTSCFMSRAEELEVVLSEDGEESSVGLSTMPPSVAASLDCHVALADHLVLKRHSDLLQEVESGALQLVSRAASIIAKRVNERAEVALSRFRAGLRLHGRFCTSAQACAAGELTRVRDLDIPVKVLRRLFPDKERDILWLTSEELKLAEEDGCGLIRKPPRRLRGFSESDASGSTLPSTNKKRVDKAGRRRRSGTL